MKLSKSKLGIAKIVLISLALVTIISAALFLRSPYVSEKLRAIVLPRVESHAGVNVEAGSFYINLLPLYLGINDVQLNGVASVGRVRVYVDSAALIMGSLSIDRVVLDAPSASLTPESLHKFSAIKDKDDGGDEESISFDGVIVVNNGTFKYVTHSGKGGDLLLKGVDIEAALGSQVWLSFNIKDIHYDIPGQRWPSIDTSIKGAVTYEKAVLDIVNFSAVMGGSKIKINGRVNNPATADMDGILALDLDFKPASLKNSFGLRSNTMGQIEADGELRLRPTVNESSLSLDITGDFRLETLLESLRVKPELVRQLTGRIKAKGTLAGKLNDLKGQASAIISDSVMYDLTLEHATAKVTYDGGRLHIAEGKVKIYNGLAKVDVAFNVLRHEPFSVSVAFSDVDSTPALARIYIDKIGLPEGKVQGLIKSYGNAFSPEGWAKFHGLGTSNEPLGRVDYISGRFFTESRNLILDTFNVRTPLSHAVFDGLIGLTEDDIAFDGYIFTTDIKDMLIPFDYGLHGGGRVDVSVTGTKKRPVIHAMADMWDVSFRDYTFGKTTTEIVYDIDKVEIVSLESQNMDASFDIGGAIHYPLANRLFDLRVPEFEIDMDAVNASLGGIVSFFVSDIDIDGKATGQAALTGRLGALNLVGTAGISNVAAYGRDIEHVDMDYYYKDNEVGLNSSSIAAAGGRAFVSGHYNMDGTYMVNASTKSIPMTLLFPDYPGPDYKMDVNLSGLGNLKNPTVLLEARMGSVRFMDMMVGGGSLAFKLNDRHLTGELALMDDKLSAVGALNMEGRRKWNASVSMDYERYDFIARTLYSELPEDFVLALQGEVDFHGDRENVFARIDLDKANIKAFGRGFANVGPLELELKNKEVHFNNVNMRAAHMDFSINGMLEAYKRFDMNITSSASLLPFSRYFSSIQSMKGEGKLDLTLRGDWDSPGMDGFFSITDGSVALTSISQRIASINVMVRFAGNQIVVSKAEASVGGGTVSLGGIVEMAGLMSPSNINLEAEIKQVSARLRPGISAEMEGSLLLAGDSDQQQINGDLHLSKANYRDRVEWKRWLIEKRNKPTKTKSSWQRKVSLNIKIHGEDSLVIENNLLSTRLRVDLFTKGTLAEPALLGRIEALQGKVFFRSSELNIISGTADFSDLDPGKPILSLIAEDSIKGYDIWLNMEGKSDRLNLTLSSNPPLEDTEILALLTYGDLGSSVGGIESGLGAAEATFLLTGKLQDLMEERLALFTGLDRLQIDPYVSHSTGAITPRLVAAKKLMDNKINMTYSSTMDATSEQEIKVEYMFDDNISIEAGKNYTGSVGGDLKLRFEFE